MAMSRALGAAFLNHQVQQLEKSVQGAASHNWRDRKAADGQRGPPRGGTRRGATPQMRSANAHANAEARDVGREADRTRDSRRKSEDSRDDKVADIIVVDASVLVHALGHLKSWCRDGRDEIIIIPLEGQDRHATLARSPR